MLPRTSLVFLSLLLLPLACVPEGSEIPGEPSSPDSGSDSDALDALPEVIISASGADPDEEDPVRWDEDLPVVLPPWWKCGDGEVDSWEQCDNGELNSEYGECTPICQKPWCGDGYHHPSEECDLGSENGQDLNAYGSCTASCKIATGCGDGVVQPDLEECDHGAGGSPTCAPNCKWFGRIMFVTQGKFTGGEIGGIVGANAICESEAQGKFANADTFRAWLSTGAESVSDWLEEDMANSSIMRPDGAVIADTLELLKQTEGNLGAPILVTAAGVELASEAVWTNTSSGGLSEGSDSCDSWTSSADDDYGRRGLSGEISKAWTSINGKVDCASARRLYCLEQPTVGN